MRYGIYALQVSPIPSCQAGDVSINLCLDDIEIYEVGLNDANCELIPILIDSPVNVVAQVLQDGQIALSSNATFIGTEVFTYAKCLHLIHQIVTPLKYMSMLCPVPR